jgi:hypothetical protein
MQLYTEETKVEDLKLMLIFDIFIQKLLTLLCIIIYS